MTDKGRHGSLRRIHTDHTRFAEKRSRFTYETVAYAEQIGHCTNREQRFMLFLKACTSVRVMLVCVLIKKRIGHFSSTIVLSSLLAPLVNLKFIVRGCTVIRCLIDIYKLVTRVLEYPT